jgi:Zn-dependent protease with chaperone function
MTGSWRWRYFLLTAILILSSGPLFGQEIEETDLGSQKNNGYAPAGWEDALDQAASDRSLNEASKREVYEGVISGKCAKPKDPDCEAVFKHLGFLCTTENQQAWLGFMRASVLSGDTSQTWQAVKLYQEVAAKYPGADFAAQSLLTLYSLDQGQFGRYVDDQALAEAEDAFVRKSPTHRDSPEIAWQRVMLQPRLGDNFTPLWSLLRFYKANAGGEFPVRLNYPLKIVSNLQQPFKAVFMSLLFFSIPIIIFLGARFMLFDPENPGAGKLTPQNAKILQWVLAVSLVPISVAVNAVYTPGEVIMIKLLGHPLALSASGTLPGASVVGYMLIIIPMTVLILLNSALAGAGVNRLEVQGRKLTWYLPADYNRTIIICWAAFTIGLVALFHFLFHGYFYAATAIALAMLAPCFYIIVHLISPLYASGPLPEGALKDYIRQTCSQFELPVKEIYQAEFSFKMIDALTVANFFGPARIYVDPELLRGLSRNEFHTLLVHNIAHLKKNHKLKVTAAGGAMTGLLVLMVVLGSLSPSLKWLAPGWFMNTLVLIATLAIAGWDVKNEHEADEFVVKRTQMFQDYINLILKLNGLMPAEVDIARIDFAPVLNKAKKQRLNYILNEWRSAAAKAAPPQDQPQPAPGPGQAQPVDVKPIDPYGP